MIEKLHRATLDKVRNMHPPLRITNCGKILTKKKEEHERVKIESSRKTVKIMRKAQAAQEGPRAMKPSLQRRTYRGPPRTRLPREAPKQAEEKQTTQVIHSQLTYLHRAFEAELQLWIPLRFVLMAKQRLTPKLLHKVNKVPAHTAPGFPYVKYTK